MDMDYEFEDVTVTLNGKEYLASGYVGIEFDEEPDDLSVGYKGGAVINGIGFLSAELSDDDGNIIVIKGKNTKEVNIIVDSLDTYKIQIACDDWLSNDC